MKRLDYRLEYLLQRRSGEIRREALGREKLIAATTEGPKVRVLLHFKNALAPIVEIGLEVTSQAGDIVAGYISLTNLERIASHPNVISVEASRPLKPELDVSTLEMGVKELRAQLDAANIPCRGRGVIIGIIDSSFDLTHPCFRTAENRTRILYAWDQTREEGEEGKAPAEIPYGIEYTPARIEKAIHDDEILVIADRPAAALPNPHGTHVTGIAGGNGAAAPANTYIGVAPEADLILVAYNSEGSL
jgi:hypothetical protein